MLRVAELCAGYGGLFAGLRCAGVEAELAWYAETDTDACTVIAAHHPGVRNVGDITEAQFSAQEPVDIIAAGWPCQPISGAGKQLGAADERWLWPDVARAVTALKPALFVGENVPGLLTIAGGVLFGAVLADLDWLGYTVRWTTVGACKVGLCHHRHRVFLVASREPVEPDRWPLARRHGGGWETAADTLFGVGLPPRWPYAGVASGGAVWGLPADPCGDSGVALLPTPGARLGDGRGAPGADLAAARMDSGRRNLDDAVALLPTPTAVHHARSATANRRDPKATTNTDGWTLSDVAYANRWCEYGPAVRRHEGVTGSRAPEPTESNTQGGVRLAAPFPEWMQTLTPGYVTDLVPRNAALRLIGNGIAPLQGAYAWRLLTAALPNLEVSR